MSSIGVGILDGAAGVSSDGLLQSAYTVGDAARDPDNWPYLNVQKLPLEYADTADPGTVRLEVVEKFYAPSLDVYMSAVKRALLYDGISNLDLGYEVLPYSTEPTMMRLTATPGVLVTIRLYGGFSNRGTPTSVINRIPSQTRTVVPVRLPRGQSLIVVTQGSKQFVIALTTSRLATLAHGVSRELFLCADQRLRSLLDSIGSRLSSRLAEIGLPYGDLISYDKPLQIIGVRGLELAVAQAGSESGVLLAASVLTTNTPVLRDIDAQEADSVGGVPVDDLDIRYGTEMNVWLRSRASVVRELFARLTTNLRGTFHVTSVSDKSAVVQQEGSTQETHHFYNLRDLPDDIGYEDTSMSVSSATATRCVMDGMTFTEHPEVDRCSRMGRRFLDCGEFDAFVLDYEEAYDLNGTGWVGLAITEGHLDPKAYVGEPQPMTHFNVFDCAWLWGTPCVALISDVLYSYTEEDALVANLINTL